ncbi:hypothetical protein BC332_24543 [Capsicum chinense]|nr:hypothetical protein BC332_24543 [Capsicum chinense]
MAYRVITCLMRTIHQSMELTGCDLQPFYEKLECLRAILEKPWKATDDVEALTSLEAEITELAYSAEDMIDLESMDGNIVQHERSKSTNVPLAGLPEHAVERTQNMMVGYETEFEMMLDQLARGERELEVVSVVDRLQKLLKRKRYLVVIDDMWTTEAWDDIKLCFPDSNNGSRILLRNVEVAEYASSEDQLIFVDKVVQLWVAEGFLKVEEMKSIGEVAETCLNQLIDRSLISICEHPRFGKIESCGMHDVTREFCLREAQNMNFLNDLRGKSDQNSCTQSMQCSFQTQARISLQYPIMLLFEILTMPQLRHLRLDWNYLRSHEPTEKSLVLKNLQCFSGLNPRYFTGSFFRLFPNLKKLGVRGVPEDFSSCKDMYDFSSLDDVPLLLLPPSDAFPQNLKSLALRGQFFLPWKDLSIVGKLPKLESLKLSYNACEGVECEVAAEGFPRLKFLQLNYLGIQIQQDIQDSYGCSVEVHTRPIPPVDCLLSPIGLPLRPDNECSKKVPSLFFYTEDGVLVHENECSSKIKNAQKPV